MSYAILDTETTGVIQQATVDNPSPQLPEVIQLAYMVFNDDGQLVHEEEKLYKPTRPIEKEAMAVHGITNKMVEDAPSVLTLAVPKVDYMVAHNTDFDYTVLGSPSATKPVCTLMLSRNLFPEFKQHKLGTLMYYLFDEEEARRVTANAHDAMSDVKMCYMLLDKIKERYKEKFGKEAGIEDLYQLSEEQRLKEASTIRFGKHKGKTIEEVGKEDMGWLVWAVGKFTDTCQNGGQFEAIDKSLVKAIKKTFPNKFNLLDVDKLMETHAKVVEEAKTKPKSSTTKNKPAAR